MGQVMIKLANGSEDEEKKAKRIEPIIDECYNNITVDAKDYAGFYRAVCQAVEEINKQLGNTQFSVPSTTKLQEAFEKHHKGKESGSLTKEEFGKILQDVIYGAGLTGTGAKAMLLSIFGVPIMSMFIKQRIIPKAIPNELFLPCITSATVFILAKLNKI
ncbi:PREDICTED: uncharacterized protein LOC104606159 [Nelumbo nucifera]|uniref:EF-hand domain-containing protein n=2 Tax=Nelumbo nucifera TaxID=4432 RepID=A0A822YVN7_NELNU|nr:PREDICTED: uncharacterized protein LOC104606159 [Nelumbo nucifera]DAD33308.1 TPA_asm: hypothetical protein HUJ06_012159 [Nelumbo nucifera]